MHTIRLKRRHFLPGSLCICSFWAGTAMLNVDTRACGRLCIISNSMEVIFLSFMEKYVFILDILYIIHSACWLLLYCAKCVFYLVTRYILFNCIMYKFAVNFVVFISSCCLLCVFCSGHSLGFWECKNQLRQSFLL